MKCPECGFENNLDKKFCIECGQRLASKCPQCGSEVESHAKFCGECGTKIGSSGPDLSPLEEKLDKIQRYLPQGLTDKILAQKDRIEGERKIVTVLFCDLVGYTAMANKLDPEDTFNLMDQVSEILIHKVHDYGGTVNQWTGDGLYALFGAPIALEDGPQRAIRSAMDMHKELTKFSDEIIKEKDISPLRMRIGINTGPVVLGTIGNTLRVDFTALGDTVNLGSRMEGLAEPGTIYVTEETFKQTEHFFRFEALGGKEVKGFDAPIPVYRVIDRTNRSTRFDVSAERGLTPFVGRERELEVLLDGFNMAKSGRGQAISIVAEAGIGKSRLLYEFRKAIANEDVFILEGKCLSFARNTAYRPVIEILKAYFQIEDNDPDTAIQDKVANGLEAIEVDEASSLPYILDLIGVKNTGTDKLSMSPQGKKEQVIEIMSRIAVKGSEVRLLVLAIEDLHWIDKSSEDALKNLLESIPGARVLLIFTYRSEFVHTWGGRSYHSQINLNRLSNRESLVLANYILGTDEIDIALEDVILEKTEGVPFFVEEFIKSLKELGIVKKRDNRSYLAKEIQDVIIPSTIQDIIMGRVDTLPEAAKEVLQIGSVIEREFSYEMIKRVTGVPQEELLSILSILKDSELIYERGIYPHSTYIFKHALTREVVYDSIISKKRKQRHVQVGQAMEDLFGEKLDEYIGILAEHFIAGDDYQKGAQYSRSAARKAAWSGFSYVAVPHAENWVRCVENLQESEDKHRQIIDARTALATFSLDTGWKSLANEGIEKIIDLAKKYDNKKRLGQLYTIIGTRSYFSEEDYPKALSLLEKAIKITGEANDRTNEAAAHYWMGTVDSWNCEFEKAAFHWDIYYEFNRAAQNKSWTSQVKSSMAMSNCFIGNVDQIFQHSNEAMQLAEEAGDIQSKGLANSTFGMYYYAKGLFEEAEKYFLTGCNYLEKINYRGWIGITRERLGNLSFDLGKYQESLQQYQLATEVYEKSGSFVGSGKTNKIGTFRARVMIGETDIDLQTLFGYIAEIKMKNYQGTIRGYLAEILMNIDDQHMDEAEKWTKEAIETDKQNGMIWNVGRHHALYADFFKRQNNLPQAREQMNKAISIMKECGADGWVARYEKELAELS